MWNLTRFRLRDTGRRVSDTFQWNRARLLAIPAVELMVRTVQELMADDATHMAAGVAYYAILSLFPLMLGLLAIFGLFLPSEAIKEELFDFFERNLPGAVDVLQQNIEDVIRLRGAVGVVSLVLLFWSASAMFGALSRAINRAWDIHRDRPFHIRKLRDLTMALGTGILFVVSVGATSALSILPATDLPVLGVAANVGARFFAFLSSLAIFLLLYKFIPNTKTYWRFVWPGALLAAILFEIAKSLFVLYLDRFANYELVYGSVGSVIALLVWIYVSAFIIILGAEFSAEYGRMRRGAGRGIPLAAQQAEPEETDSPD
jgi:membrane protein